MHPDTRLVVDDEGLGCGVVATRRIPRGTITWVRDALDRAFTPAEIDALPTCYEPLIIQWTFGEHGGTRVLCWDLGRFMNHSCAPNCGGTALGFEIALRDIEPGEELTNDYETFHLDPPERFECRCGVPSCRRVVQHGPDPAAVAAVHRRLVVAAASVRLVEQPLATLLHPERLVDALGLLGLR